MKKLSLYALVLILSISLTGCFFDSPEDAAVEYINTLYGKSEDGKPTPEERLETFEELLSAERKKEFDGNKDRVKNTMEDATTKGLQKPYFVAEDPSEPAADTYRVVLVRLPKSSFAEPPTGFFGNDIYMKITLRKEDGDWKVHDLKTVREDDLPKGEEIDWKEVDPM